MQIKVQHMLTVVYLLVQVPCDLLVQAPCGLLRISTCSCSNTYDETHIRNSHMGSCLLSVYHAQIEQLARCHKMQSITDHNA